MVPLKKFLGHLSQATIFLSALFLESRGIETRTAIFYVIETSVSSLAVVKIITKGKKMVYTVKFVPVFRHYGLSTIPHFVLHIHK